MHIFNTPAFSRSHRNENTNLRNSPVLDNVKPKLSGTERYASEFSASNISNMRQGYAPIAVASQHDGKIKTYILHHKKPIWDGGGVYDLNNLLITTPRYHKEVLVPDYHYERGAYKK